MKRFQCLLGAIWLIFCMTACTTNDAEAGNTWQEQYDLGVRYLSEGNYEDAIIAFTAAIEIDPKQPEAYLGLADVYEAQGDLESLRAILEQGFQATEDARLEERLDALGTSSGSPDTMPEVPEVLNESMRAPLDEYRYIPFNEEAAQALSPLIDAGTSGSRDEALALVGSEDFWAGLRQALWDNLLAHEEYSPLELSPDGPQAQEGSLNFWTQWDGSLIYFECVYGEAGSDYVVEYRPWEGAAFQCSLFRRADGDSVNFRSGSTSGWLLNGNVTLWAQQRDGDTYQGEGTAVDELLDGPYEHTEVTGSGSFTNSYQYSDGLMIPCWQGEDGRMYAIKRVHDDGDIDYWEDSSGDRVDYGFFGPHMT